MNVRFQFMNGKEDAAMRRYGVNKGGTVARLWYGKPVTELTELETAQFTVDTDIKLFNRITEETKEALENAGFVIDENGTVSVA